MTGFHRTIDGDRDYIAFHVPRAGINFERWESGGVEEWRIEVEDAHVAWRMAECFAEAAQFKCTNPAPSRFVGRATKEEAT